VLGTEAVRRGWLIRPHRVTLRCGRPLRFPRVENPSLAEATAVTERIWPCVVVQWDWLGGKMPARPQVATGVARQRVAAA
jgi:glycerol-3-phosphate dehydrogenase (NAD(P)+)